MEDINTKSLVTNNGKEVVFKFELVPCDMKWLASMAGELSNSATYFSTFADVSQRNKDTMGGSIGEKNSTWQPWNYSKRIAMAKKVELYKKTPRDLVKQRSHVTKYIANGGSWQEFPPPLCKFVDLAKAEPLHNMNNAWQNWFTVLLAKAFHCSNKDLLTALTSFSFVPVTSPFAKVLNSVKETVKCGRLYKNYCRWFSEKRKKGLPFSYRFTGLESKNFAQNFASPIKVLLDCKDLTKGVFVKLHSLAHSAILLRDATSLFTRVKITKEQTEELASLCTTYFNRNSLLLSNVNPTIWTIGYVIPYHTKLLFNKLGYGLGLNSMQGREAKHCKLKDFIANTCSGRKNQQWWTVLRHEYVSLLWL